METFVRHSEFFFTSIVALPLILVFLMAVVPKTRKVLGIVLVSIVIAVLVLSPETAKFTNMKPVLNAWDNLYVELYKQDKATTGEFLAWRTHYTGQPLWKARFSALWLKTVG